MAEIRSMAKCTYIRTASLRLWPYVLAVTLGSHLLFSPERLSSEQVRRAATHAGRSGYADIKGAKLKLDVEQLARIARGRQLKGEQYWGRIAGTDADHETEQWILNRFQKLGLADTKIQELDLPPQWLPRSWRVMASADSGTAELATVQPVLGSPGTNQRTQL